MNELKEYIRQFEEAVKSHDVEHSWTLLVEAVKEFRPQCEVADLVRSKNTKVSKEQSNGNVVRYLG